MSQTAAQARGRIKAVATRKLGDFEAPRIINDATLRAVNVIPYPAKKLTVEELAILCHLPYHDGRVG